MTRLAAVYAALLAAIVYVFELWPTDMLYFWTLVEHPFLAHFNLWIWTVAWGLVAVLGLLGLMRRNPWSRTLAAGTLLAARSWILLYVFDGADPVLDAVNWVLYWVVEVPLRWGYRLGDGSPAIATPWFAAYFATLYLVARPILKRRGPELMLNARERGRRLRTGLECRWTALRGV